MAAVRFLIVPGIGKTSSALNFSHKVRGQLLGYATSTPELVIVASSAASGVFDVGFWNIASSNIINWLLFLGALFLFQQYRDLRKITFIDEFSFGLFSVILPLALYTFEVQSSVLLCTVLLFVFFSYKALDSILNRRVAIAERNEKKAGNLFAGVIRMVSGVLVIVVAGRYLGGIAEDLVVELGVASWLIGWILGLVSSIPEMGGFIEIYRKHKEDRTIDGIDDTQEALDSLVASNMSNLCIILPIGGFIVALL
jgi:Ca2+/Na+ antiporter